MNEKMIRDVLIRELSHTSVRMGMYDEQITFISQVVSIHLCSECNKYYTFSSKMVIKPSEKYDGFVLFFATWDGKDIDKYIKHRLHFVDTDDKRFVFDKVKQRRTKIDAQYWRKWLANQHHERVFKI